MKPKRLNLLVLAKWLVSIIIIAGLIIVAFYLVQTRQELEQDKQHFGQQENQINLLVSELKDQTNTWQKTQEKINQLTNTVNLQKNQQALSQITFLIQLANFHLLINNDATKSEILLQQAYNQVNQLNDPMFLNLSNGLAKDIAQLKSLPKIDIPVLIARLDNLNNLIQKLPIEITQFSKKIQPKMEKSTNWQQRWENLVTNFKSLIIIRRTSTPTPALLPPNQLIYLKENIQSKIFQAEWAALHHEPLLYRNSLDTAQQWLDKYFNNLSDSKQIRNQIQELENINIKPNLPNELVSLKILNQLKMENSENVINPPVANKKNKFSSPPLKKMRGIQI